MADKFATNDKVFAKLKGFPPWPAKIMERAGGTGKDEKYRIIFYGTHDEATVKWDQIFLYNADTKAKYGKPTRKSQFKEAMTEIEADMALDEEDEGVENALESIDENEGGNAKEESEGELTIDESGPLSLPPVLKREIVKPDISESGNKRQRSLSKRDSLNPLAILPAPTMPLTPATPTTPDSGPPGTEIVSRSGRKIKPKRFADDEITPGPKGKPGMEDGQPAVKRAKRGSTSTSSKSATPLKANSEDVSSQENEDAASSQAKGMAGAPSLKAVPKRAVAAGNNKKLPSLEPTPIKIPTTPVRKSERQTRSNSVDGKEEDSIEAGVAECSRAPDIDESEVDKENSNGEAPEGATAMNNASDDDTKFAKPRLPKDSAQVPERKIRVSTKSGLKFELSFDAKSSDCRNDEENKTWQAIATQNVRKVIEDLKEGDAESQDIINSAAECIPSRTVVETKSREKLSSQLKLLRLEGEVIEIIGEIVGCLGIHSADCIRAIDLLDRLEEHKLNPLMLKKHPEVVHTVHKLRSYVGNVEAWGFTSEQSEEFAMYAEEIRGKAVAIFNHFQELFGIDSSETFAEVFQEEVRKFKDQVDQFSLKKMLGLTEENGELRELAMEMNGDVGECDSDIHCQ